MDRADPRLVAIAGPLGGRVFPLEVPETGIGRDTANRIAVSDARLSRRHAVVRCDRGSPPVVCDLASRNGTFVNGVPIRERQLAHGDRIELGASTFLYLDREVDDAPQPESLHLDSGSWRTKATIEVTRDSLTLLVHGDRPPRAEPATTGILAQLLEATRALYSTTSVEDWAGRLGQALFAMLPAERAAVLLAGSSGRLDTSLGWIRGSQETCAVLVDDALVQRAIGGSVAVLAEHDGEGIAVAPLLATQECRGAVVIQSTGALAEPHLDVLAAIGATAAGALEHVREVAWLVGERRRLAEELRAEHEMVGESPAMRRVYDMIARVAPSDATVLIQGESGTGKELVARALHTNSARSERPFVALNCAAVSENLLESELFGHERGAFTGAVARKLGKLEVAHRGTLLLDEVGEMSPSLQAKLLRVLESRQLERVGGTTPISIDVRILAATNRDLEQAVKDGTFRSDLFYRLNVVRIPLPPLRDRREDIPLLASHFASRSARALKRPLVAIAPAARERLLQHDWPGNVRELRNAIEHAIVLGTDDVLRPEDLPEHVAEGATGVAGDAAEPARYHEALRETKIRLIRQAIEEAQGSIVGAAAILGLHPNYLHRLLRNLGLRNHE
jgi:DNA-binding NtrC family response regulator